MGRRPTKAANNPFCKARIDAAKYNDSLFSKEKAAEFLGISVSTLSDYELVFTKDGGIISCPGTRELLLYKCVSSGWRYAKGGYCDFG